MFAHLNLATKKVYLTPQEFLAACVGYFKWVEETPLLEEQVFQNKGAIVRANKAKCRAYTRKGLAQHLSIPESRLEGYRQRGGEWEEAIELVEQAIYIQKFENAAAGLLNPTIIARDLGLAEKQEFSGTKDAPPVAFTINPIASGTFLDTAKAEQTE